MKSMTIMLPKKLYVTITIQEKHHELKVSWGAWESLERERKKKETGIIMFYT